MAKLHCLSLLQCPRDAAFLAARDDIERAVESVEYIDRVVCESRFERAPGVVETTRTWVARFAIPAALESVIGAQQVVWTDYSVWTTDDFACRWRIVPAHFPGVIVCNGATRFSKTTRAQTTTVAFEGTLVVDPMRVPPPADGAVVARLVEEVIAGFVPLGVRRVLDGLGRIAS